MQVKHAVFLIISIQWLIVISAKAGELNAKNAESWELSGLIQLQYDFNSNIDSDSDRTNNGFRIRTGRLQAKSKLTDWVSTKFQVEIRDNSPRLKDAEGKIQLGSVFVRVGQFKVPVWREELRSSGSLLLVERSEAAGFLEDSRLSARHVGVEMGGMSGGGISWAVNLSNGAGEGGRETSGTTKTNDINNGKLVSARIHVPVSGTMQVGFSGTVNRLGANIGVSKNTGTVYAFAPDLGLYLPSGLDVEAGFAIGSIDADLVGASDDQDFKLFDVTGRWLSRLETINEDFGGMSAFELAGGVTFVEPSQASDNESFYVRFGPAVYFGSKARVQLNAEIEKPSADGADTIFTFRAQSTFNF